MQQKPVPAGVLTVQHSRPLCRDASPVSMFIAPFPMRRSRPSARRDDVPGDGARDTGQVMGTEVTGGHQA